MRAYPRTSDAEMPDHDMPGEIKKHLKNVGFTKPYGETYFYTAMKRAAEKKAIVKKSDGRYRIASNPAPNANGDARDG